MTPREQRTEAWIDTLISVIKAQDTKIQNLTKQIKELSSSCQK
jgi:cell division protein FtsL